MGLLIILLSVILFTWSQNLIKGEPTAKDITTNININENINFKPPTTRNNDIIHLNGGNTTESTKLEAEDKVVFRNNKIVIRQAILKGDSPVSSDILTRCLGVFALSSCQADTIQVKVFNILEDQYSSKFCFSLATFFQKDYPCFEAKSTSEGIAFKSIQGNDSNVDSLIMLLQRTQLEIESVALSRSSTILASVED
ncbi:uncharacterized protein LOC124355918 [Homalodisca vitripennis]|uniref:uncharacterized protein LOC124355918 n=1 Tax=Homalodisca vitripennis TaxID=197043 RepID=UPI001EEB4798|nr:uncharacterized protein LOC124355918 [Homalodisca vitripennis]